MDLKVVSLTSVMAAAFTRPVPAGCEHGTALRPNQIEFSHDLGHKRSFTHRSRGTGDSGDHRLHQS